jgi:hypothetical protein
MTVALFFKNLIRYHNDTTTEEFINNEYKETYPNKQQYLAALLDKQIFTVWYMRSACNRPVAMHILEQLPEMLSFRLGMIFSKTDFDKHKAD